MFSAETFASRLKQGNLASKNDIVNFVKKSDFDNKLKDVISNKNELNELSKNAKAISTKGLTKDLITKLINTYFSGTTWIESWKSKGKQQFCTNFCW